VNCIAHRGFAGVNAENTLPAILDAAERADGVELDLRRCGSDEVVVHHDETVDRTTNESGPLSAFAAAELADLYVEGTDAGVPTFARVVESVPESTTLHVELKERGFWADARAVLAGADAAPSVVVSSFDPDALGAVEAYPTALLVTDGEGAIQRARQAGCEGLHPASNACSRTLVTAAREAGLAVNAWTVTEPAETARLREVGVDGVITDFPACCPGAVAEQTVG